MIMNELRKIFAPRMVVLLLMVAVVLYAAWPLGQMNLSHLPLFETVELKCGTELVERYGTTLDGQELDEIERMAEAARQSLDRNLLAEFPKVGALGCHSYDEWQTYYMADENWDKEEIQILRDQVWDALGWDIEKTTYYEQLCISAKWDFENWGVSEVSTLPPSVFSNTNFVLEDSFRILMYLVLILVLPYLAWDNLSGIKPLTATSKCGRTFILKQLAAMMIAVVVVVSLWCLVIYFGLRICTDYEPLFSCPVREAAGNLTFHEFLVLKLILVGGSTIGLSMIYFFISSFCKTIVGTVAAAIPCWGAGELLSIFVLNHYLEAKLPGIGMSAYNDYLAEIDGFPLWFDGMLLVVGTVLTVILYYLRKTEDILE